MRRPWFRRIAAPVLAAVALAGPAALVARPAGAAIEPGVLRQALAGAQLLRTFVASFYVERNRFPMAREARRFPLPLDPGPARLLDRGIIALDVATDPHGGAAHVYLVPTLGPSGLAWSCVSPDAPDVGAAAPGCRHDPSFSVSPASVAELEAKRFPPGTVVVHIDNRPLALDPGTLLAPNATPSLLDFGRFDPLDRERIIAGAATAVAGRVDTLDKAVNYARWLASGGDAALGPLEAQLRTGTAELAAPALLALCLRSNATWPTFYDRACLRAPREGADGARTRLVTLMRTALEQEVGTATAGTRLDCRDAVAIGAALGRYARPAVPALDALLRDARERDGQRALQCPPALVASALVEILETPPRATAQAASADAATLALFEAKLDIDAVTVPVPEEVTRLLDARPPLPSLRAALADFAHTWSSTCHPVSWDAVRDVARLGKPGFEAVVLLLDGYAERDCETRSQVVRLLPSVMQAYPFDALPRYASARTVLTRDDLMTAAIDSVAAGTPDSAEAPEAAGAHAQEAGVATPTPDAHRLARIAAALRRFLADTGYLEVKFSDTAILFPAGSGLRWSPIESRSIAVGERAAGVDLAQAYAALVADHPACSIPPGAANVRSVVAAKRLFVFHCNATAEPDSESAGGPAAEAMPPLVVIGSPTGFKVMKFPPRVEQAQREAESSIVGVADSDGDGNLEVYLRLPCEGRDCAEEPDTPVLLEEDGDWFTWFRLPPRPRRS